MADAEESEQGRNKHPPNPVKFRRNLRAGRRKMYQINVRQFFDWRRTHMSASERRLVLLDSRYPDVSRMTRWRIEQEPDFPNPIIVRGRKYYDEHELRIFEEKHRRVSRRDETITERNGRG
jgi:hypothetical protein